MGMKRQIVTWGWILAAALGAGIAAPDATGGGRIVVDGARPSGFFKSTRITRQPAAAVLAELERAGTKARRQLADVDGVSYFEGRK